MPVGRALSSRPCACGLRRPAPSRHGLIAATLASSVANRLLLIHMTRSDDALVQRLSACGPGSLYLQRAAADEGAHNRVFEEDEELVSRSVENIIDHATDVQVLYTCCIVQDLGCVIQSHRDAAMSIVSV